jgi:hypothetical protein
MTHDPRLATLEEIMNGSPFDIIDSPWGHVERWRASTLATGTMGALTSVYDLVRSDSTIADARADAIAARDAEIRGQIVKLITGLDSLTARVDSIEAENRAAKADAARKAAFDEEPLTLPQGDPPGSGELSEPAPTGDLHEVAAKSKLSDHDNIGDLPEELQLPKPEPEPEPEPKGSVQQQPISVSLNEG